MKKNFALGMAVIAIVLSALVISLISCGGGGGSSGGSTTESSGTGSVALLLADSPTDDYEHIWLWITEVSLVPVAHNSAPVVIFRSAAGLKVDLLEYRDEDYLLTIKKDVPAGLYAKIRLEIKDIQVEPKAGLTPSCANLEIKLPSGKIDLNPREPFLVSQDGKLSIRLDIDAHKSINLHKAGRSGKCIFRPVVFVDIKEGMPVGKCPKILSGTIVDLIKNGGQTSGFLLNLANDRGSLQVNLLENTVLFDEDGEFVGPEALQVEQEVKVRGKLNINGALEASLVIIGDLLDISGQVNGPVDTTSYLFPLTPSAGEEITFPIDVKVVQEKTLILISCNTEVGIGYIQAGMRARVFGKMIQENGEEIIQAVAILLQDVVIEGEIMSMSNDLDGKKVTIQEQGGLVPVFIPTGAPVYLDGNGAIPMNLLCVGRQVRVFIEPGMSSPLTAALVKVQSEKQEGTVAAIDSTSRFLTVNLEGGGTGEVYAESGATILESNDGIQGLGQFDDIKVEDYLVYFGLSDCDPTKPFHAFVLVITTD